MVQEVEEIQTVDRRGNIKYRMQAVQQDQPAPKQTLPHNQKQARLKSPSPVASGSKHHFQKHKTSKVCTM